MLSQRVAARDLQVLLLSARARAAFGRTEILRKAMSTWQQDHFLSCSGAEAAARSSRSPRSQVFAKVMRFNNFKPAVLVSFCVRWCKGKVFTHF